MQIHSCMMPFFASGHLSSPKVHSLYAFAIGWLNWQSDGPSVQSYGPQTEVDWVV